MNFTNNLSLWQKIRLFFAKSNVVIGVDMGYHTPEDASLVKTTYKKVGDKYFVTKFEVIKNLRPGLIN